MFPTSYIIVWIIMLVLPYFLAFIFYKKNITKLAPNLKIYQYVLNELIMLEIQYLKFSFTSISFQLYKSLIDFIVYKINQTIKMK